MVKDFADSPAALNEEGAAYVVIGGIAVLRYVPYRTTRDLGLLRVEVHSRVSGVTWEEVRRR